MAILRSNRLQFGATACLVALSTLLLIASPCAAQTKNSCMECHSALPEPLGVAQESFGHDVHAQKGLTCVSCHGGDASSDDPEKAMSVKAGWKGKIDRKQVPQLCGSCHSDPAYMRQFNPGLRTDQLAQYRTSVHGRRLAAGDTNVAVCTDCHGLHNLRAPGDPQSSVYPVNVAATCSHCHADSAHMKPDKIPIDQYAKYNTSVHHEDMVVAGDLSAPTCSTCHGNHGAVPPGVDKVQNVCSKCHVFQTQMYDQSSHQAAFDGASLPGCVVCHSNHGIQRPSDAKLSTGSEGVCLQCHAPGDKCDQARAAMLADLTQLDRAIKDADAKLAQAESVGMDVTEARMGQSQAKDALTRARVAIHSFQTGVVSQQAQAGLRIANKDLEAGRQAMAERDRRRKGLSVSLLADGMMLMGLWMYIRKIEK